MKSKAIISLKIILCLILFLNSFTSCSSNGWSDDHKGKRNNYSYEVYPLVRNNIALHLDKVALMGKNPKKNILLIHGVTYSSHEFDIDYKDYSFVKMLARNGYNVWRLDIAGYGQSQEVQNGYMPNINYAAEDIASAVEKILQETQSEKIDILGWSWGTTTASKFASSHQDQVNKLILYAPILSGIGNCDYSTPFHHNSWIHAIDDFQKKDDGIVDYSIADPVIVEMFASSCWHYDGEYSPNGGRKDVCSPKSKRLIDLTQLKIPTLLIYGDNDPYLNYDLINEAKTLQETQDITFEMIHGGAHVVMFEKPYYKDFQNRIVRFLKRR